MPRGRPKKTGTNRDWDDPVYVQFRKDVLRRDKHTCQMCGAKERLQVHHILKWAGAAALRYEVSNGICVCWTCHNSIKGKEEHYASYFREILSGKEKDK